MLTRIMLGVAIVLAASHAAAAQDHRLYTGAGVMRSSQDSTSLGETSPSFPRSGIGGSATGVIGEVGWFLAPAIDISIEVGVPRRFESVQDTVGFSVFRQHSAHRDIVLSALAHVHSPKSGRVRGAILGGFALVHESTIQRRAEQIEQLGIFTGRFGPYGQESTLTRWTVGGTLGADLEISIAQRIAIVPEVRIHLIRRADDVATASGVLGLNSVVLRPGIGIRAAF